MRKVSSNPAMFNMTKGRHHRIIEIVGGGMKGSETRFKQTSEF